jgi:hypothetical protein
MLASRHCLWLSVLVMAREFKAVRFFVMMALAAFVVCGVTVFYTHRAAHGRTAEERSAYAIGLKAGEQAPVETILPTDAELNMMAQKYFKAAGVRRPAELGPGVRKRLHRRIQRETQPLNQRVRQVPVGAFALSALSGAFRHFCSIPNDFE